MKNILVFIILSFVINIASPAQQTFEIKILAKNKEGKIWLRWAPDNPVVWQLGNQYGYHIERFDLLENGKLIEDVARKGKRLTSIPIKPFSLERLEKLSSTDDRAGVLIETIYKEHAETSMASPADIIQQKNEQENSFGFALFICDLSTQMAEAAGLFFEDTQVEQGHRYAYRISLAHQPDDITVQPAVKTIDSKAEEPMTEILDLESKFSDRKVTLAWSEMKYYGIYSAYYIQKSTDGKNFQNISELPYVHVSDEKELNYQYFVDSLPDNSTKFYYRIVGLTPFGEKGNPSNVVSGSGIDILFGAVYIDTVYLQQDENIIQFKVDPVLQEQIDNIYIARANHADGPYLPINKKPLKQHEKQFTDQQPGYNQYYVVKYENKESHEKYQSFPYLAQITDDTPPQVPSSLSGIVDSTGQVELSWQPVPDNDLLGYRVFAAHSLNDEFIEVTREILPGPEFQEKISLHNLTKNTYYKIIAVDKRFNTSNYSEPLKITKPDILPPASPVIVKEEISGDAIILQWINSASRDVAGYKLLREDVTSDTLLLIDQWNNIGRDSFSDNNNLKLSHYYRYHLIAKDSSKNETTVYSRPIYYETGIRPGVKMVNTRIDRQKKHIIIEWQKQDDCQGYYVYRASGDKNWSLYFTNNENSNVYVDDNLQESTIYRYKIKLKYADGKTSPLSDALEVKF